MALTGLGCLGVMVFAPPLSRGQTRPADPAADVKVALPVIPDHKFNVLDFGGVGDGKTINTEAFAKAVAAIRNAGGGRLEIPPGTFLTLSLQLTSHIDLHLDAGAVIKTPETLTGWGLPDPDSATQDDVDEFGRWGVISAAS